MTEQELKIYFDYVQLEAPLYGDQTRREIGVVFSRVSHQKSRGGVQLVKVGYEAVEIRTEDREAFPAQFPIKTPIEARLPGQELKIVP